MLYHVVSRKEITLENKRDFPLQMHTGRNLFVYGNHWNNFWTQISKKKNKFKRMIQSSPGTSAGLSPLPLHDSARCTKKGSQASCKNLSKMDAGQTIQPFPLWKAVGFGYQVAESQVNDRSCPGASLMVIGDADATFVAKTWKLPSLHTVFFLQIDSLSLRPGLKSCRA